jgi:hypothetical protein
MQVRSTSHEKCQVLLGWATHILLLGLQLTGYIRLPGVVDGSSELEFGILEVDHIWMVHLLRMHRGRVKQSVRLRMGESKTNVRMHLLGGFSAYILNTVELRLLEHGYCYLLVISS